MALQVPETTVENTRKDYFVNLFVDECYTIIKYIAL